MKKKTKKKTAIAATERYVIVNEADISQFQQELGAIKNRLAGIEQFSGKLHNISGDLNCIMEKMGRPVSKKRWFQW